MTGADQGIAEAAGLCERVLAEIQRAVVGHRQALELVLVGILASGHVLIEDLPGLGKTLIARSFATVLGLDFRRLQFTPDMLPSDVIGVPLIDQRTMETHFRAGPIFTNLLLADEINRTPPKTQAALLEAMGEGQVSVDGETHKLPRPFVVLATENPIEYEGTYDLPEAQLDRFLMRLRLGYLEASEEATMIEWRLARRSEEVKLERVIDGSQLLWLCDAVEQVDVAEELINYALEIVRATRGDAQVQVGASPRASLALVQAARAHALLAKRDYVVPDDIKHLAVPLLAHRVVLKPELWVRQLRADDVVAAVVSNVPTPRTAPADGRSP